jgi:hydrogenase expression/formation protein HypC
MCSVKPVLVVRVDNATAWVEGNPERSVSILGVEGVRPGDYLIVHAGIAIQRLEPAEAAAALQLFAEIEGLNALGPR